MKYSSPVTRLGGKFTTRIRVTAQNFGAENFLSGPGYYALILKLSYSLLRKPIHLKDLIDRIESLLAVRENAAE